jgi:hypothetical protein
MSGVVVADGGVLHHGEGLVGQGKEAGQGNGDGAAHRGLAVYRTGDTDALSQIRFSSIW